MCEGSEGSDGSDNSSGGNSQWSYNESAVNGMNAAIGTSNIIGVAAESTVSEMRALNAINAARSGVNAVKAVSTGASVVGGVLTVAIAGYEYKTGQANTHTFVDVGVSALGFAAIGVGVILAAPEILVAAAVGGLVYGIASACGMSTSIDKASGNWGRNLLYGK